METNSKRNRFNFSHNRSFTHTQHTCGEHKRWRKGTGGTTDKEWMEWKAIHVCIGGYWIHMRHARRIENKLHVCERWKCFCRRCPCYGRIVNFVVVTIVSHSRASLYTLVCDGELFILVIKSRHRITISTSHFYSNSHTFTLTKPFAIETKTFALATHEYSHEWKEEEREKLNDRECENEKRNFQTWQEWLHTLTQTHIALDNVTFVGRHRRRRPFELPQEIQTP